MAEYTIKNIKIYIVYLFKSGISLAYLSSKYSIARSTITDWIRDVKEIKVYENEVKKLKKEIARIKEKNEISKKLWPYLQQKIR